MERNTTFRKLEEETTNIVFDKTESSKKDNKNHNFRLIICMKNYIMCIWLHMKHFYVSRCAGYRKEEEEPCWRFGQQDDTMPKIIVIGREQKDLMQDVGFIIDGARSTYHIIQQSSLLFSQINKEGQTVLMVTRSTSGAANRVLFIKDGEVFHRIVPRQT